jgi:hypothetical protein
MSPIDDYGTLVNPLLTEAQVHGGLAQGIGQALLEEAAYDPDSGQFLSATFMDYAMPRADDIPLFELEMVEIPTKVNLLGAKGVGPGRLHRRTADGDERDPRCAAPARRHASRHAGDACQGLAGDQGCAGAQAILEHFRVSPNR